MVLIETINIRRSPAKMALLVAGALAFVVIGIWIGHMGYVEEGAGSFRLFIGILSVVFFGFCGVVGLIKLFDRRDAISIRRDGLLVPDISPAIMRWHDIEAVRLLEIKRQRMIELVLDPEASRRLPRGRFARMLENANRSLGIQGPCIAGAGLDRPVEDVARLIVERIDAARSAPSIKGL